MSNSNHLIAPLAVNKKNGQQNSHRKSMIGESNGSALSSVGTGGPVGSFAESKDTATNVGLSDSTRLDTTNTAVYEKDSRQNYSLPLRAARAEVGREKNESRILDGGSGKSPGAYEAQETQHAVRHATVDGTAAGEETLLARQLREDGIVDLRNTIDTDGDITWAPGMPYPVVPILLRENILISSQLSPTRSSNRINTRLCSTRSTARSTTTNTSIAYSRS
jgi:hypothetical protein